jgi:purine-binding chemotaxis protein CheW
MAQPETSAPQAQNRRGQFLTFILSNETYALEILRVREIRGFSPVTRVPESPHHTLGVLNLRGTIVPIVDMRRRIGIEPIEPSPLTVIIVLSVASHRGPRDFGLVVDSVSDVVDLAEVDVLPPPDINGAATEIISGIASVAGKMVMLLDADRMLGGETAALDIASAE